MAHHWLAPAGMEAIPLALTGAIPTVAVLLWRKNPDLQLASLSACFLLLGSLRYLTAIPDLKDPSVLAHYNDRSRITVEGIVRRYPEDRDISTNLCLEADTLQLDEGMRTVHGMVLVQVPRYSGVSYGDRLRVTGRLVTPPESESFSYRDYLELQRVYSFIQYPQVEQLQERKTGNALLQTSYAFREQGRQVIARLLPEPEASLLQGILLGLESGIPTNLYAAYNATGASHIIVISGFNITIIAGLFSASFGRILGKRRAYWFTLAGILLYVLLVGGDAAVLRAGIMGGLYVTALQLGRRATAYVSLFAAAMFMTLLNPLILWDAGFQLSFAATMGLVFFGHPLEQGFKAGLTRIVPAVGARRLLTLLGDALVVTLAAQILTLPLIVHYFGRLSLVAPLTNLLILPVQPPVMVVGGLAMLAGMFPGAQLLAQVVAWIPWLCLLYTNTVVRWMAGLPFASLQLGNPTLAALIAYYALVFGMIWLSRQQKHQFQQIWARTAARLPARAMVGIPVVAAILIGIALTQLPDGRLHVAFLDVGQGDAILVTTPRGQQILIDGGPSPGALTSALGKEMPFWDRSIDLVVMSHTDGDHLTGLVEALQRYRVNGWLDAGSASEDRLYHTARELVERRGVTHFVAHRGQRIDLGNGLVLDVLHPPLSETRRTKTDDNNNSLVLYLVVCQS